MKIILVRYHDKGNINTRLPDSLNKVQGVLPPLGISYVAAVLKKAGHDVKIIDAIALNLIADEVRRIIEDEKPELVGITAMISNVRGAMEAAEIAKSCNAKTVLGGPLLSLFPEETLRNKDVDYGIIGEGEYPMLKLAEAIAKGGPVEDIEGLVYKKDGIIKVNPAYINDDLDKIPFPERDLLPMDKYSSIIGLHPATTMIATRGCPFKCGFCVKGPSDAEYRTRNPVDIVDEMELLVKKYNIKEIMFYDDTITLKKGLIRQMCEEILKRGLKVKWEAPSRIDTVDFNLLKLMRKAGCIRLRYGVESGDPGILKLMNKGIDIEAVKKIFKETKKAGIETFSYFIIGYIHETVDTIKRTISLAKSLNADLAMFTVATPYPGTPLFEMAVNEGIVKRDYWKRFVLGEEQERIPYFIPDAEIWVRKAYTSFYIRLSYICGRIFKIHSLADIKKHLRAGGAILMFRSKYKETKQEAQR